MVATGLVVASGELGLAHRALALAALPPLVALAVAAWTAHPRLRVPAAAALGLMLGEIALGGLVSLTGAAWAEGLHVALAAATLGAAAWVAAASYRPSNSLLQSRTGEGSAWRDYVTLTKPRIMSLLLLTGVCGMIVGERRRCRRALDLAVLVVGLALACGGASALNHVLDRDIDRLMGKRTRARPIAAGRVRAGARARVRAGALGGLVRPAGHAREPAHRAARARREPLLRARLHAAGSSARRRRTSSSAARRAPCRRSSAGRPRPGSLGLPALFLFLIVFVWTPPHFWALALLIRKDYEAARVPMLPVVRGDRGDDAADRRLLRRPGRADARPGRDRHLRRSSTASRPRSSAACSSGSPCALLRETTPPRAAVLFHYSLAYLALLFVAMAVDPLRAVTEPLFEPEPPRDLTDPVEAERDLARRNMIFGWALFGLFVAIFAGTVVVGADLPLGAD